jgi:hypothetical protein
LEIINVNVGDLAMREQDLSEEDGIRRRWTGGRGEGEGVEGVL